MTGIEKQDRIGEMMREYREESRRQAQAASKVRESERDQAAALIASQAARIRELEEGLDTERRELIAAWESLPGGQQSISEVERWLAEKMAPVINARRSLLSRKGWE